MSKTAAIRLAKEAIDDAAEQIQLFLALEPRAARLLTREIIAESDLNTKLGKFIHLVIDRLQFQVRGSPSIAEIARDIAEIDSGAPTDPQRFRGWIVRQYAAMAEASRDHERQLCEWKDRLEDLRSQIQETTVPRAEFDAVVKARKSAEANFSKQARVYSTQISELTARVEELAGAARVLPDVEALRQQNQKLLREGADQHEADCIAIRKLRSENDRLQTALSAAQAKLESDGRKRSHKLVRELQIANDERETFQRKRLKWQTLKRTYSQTTAELETLRSALIGVQGENAQLCEKVDRLQQTLDSQLAACQHEKEDLLRRIAHLQRAKGGLGAKIETADSRLAERESEARHWRAQLDAMAQEQRAIAAKLAETEQQVRALGAPARPPPPPTTLPCRGCGVDVRRLRERFDSLESAIDQLQTTLVSPVHTRRKARRY